MKYSSLILLLASLAHYTLAAPSPALFKRGDQCSTSSATTTGSYTVINNLWNAAKGTLGSFQCFAVDSLKGNTIAWHTEWTWFGNPTQVKSFANVGLNFTPRPLSQISSIPTTWTYTITPATGLTADISYDLFTDANSANTNGAAHHDYEVMIWLSALGGAAPISSSYGTYGVPNYVAKGIEIAGVKWNLAKGESTAVGGGVVFTFVAQKSVMSLKGDLMGFLKYLQKGQGLPFSQNLVYVAAGTEPFTGSNAVMRTQAFSVQVK